MNTDYLSVNAKSLFRIALYKVCIYYPISEQILISGNRDLSVSGTGGRDAGLPIPSSPVISADSSVMGIPISLAESAASLPSLGIADVNIGTNPEPEVSFVSALDVASSVNVGLNNGAVSSTNPVVALEASSGKIEVDLKVRYYWLSSY